MTKEVLQILIKNGILSEAQMKILPKELLNNLKALEKELLEKKIIKESDLVKAKSAVFNIPHLDLSGKKADPEILKTIPESTIKRYQFVPIEKKGDDIIIGMVDPGNVEAREALKFVAVQGHFNPKIYIISKGDLDSFTGEYKSIGKEVTKALQELEEEIEKEEVKIKKGSGDAVEEISAEAPITKVVAVILKHAVEGDASDIHIEPLEDRTRVRFRVDGILHASIFLPSKIHTAIVTRVKILSNLKIDEARMPQDGRFSAKIANKKIDFRVSTFPTPSGEKAVLRVLDPTVGVGSFEDLGLIAKNLEIYKEAIKKPFGLVLVTGPTGSGKSTTLYTTLNFINSEEINMVTLEDPVEYFIEGVNQSQIRPEIKYTFSSGLRSILRQDPDIIMVGEIRDKETASLTTHAALTGHLVFSTLHTNDAIGIIPRLVNMDIKPYLLPPTLVAGVAQRLLRKLCQDCLESSEPSEAVKKMIDDSLSSVPEEVVAKYEIKQPYKVFKSKGCPSCGNSGVKGRVGVFEIFKMTPQLEGIILETISEAKLLEEAVRQGMITIKEDAIMKALKGLVSMEEVLRVIED